MGSLQDSQFRLWRLFETRWTNSFSSSPILLDRPSPDSSQFSILLFTQPALQPAQPSPWFLGYGTLRPTRASMERVSILLFLKFLHRYFQLHFLLQQSASEHNHLGFDSHVAPCRFFRLISLSSSRFAFFSVQLIVQLPTLPTPSFSQSGFLCGKGKPPRALILWKCALHDSVAKVHSSWYLDFGRQFFKYTSSVSMQLTCGGMLVHLPVGPEL